MTERWLPVVGYEGLYDVSDDGRVRSLARGAKLLTPERMKSGHLRVKLYRRQTSRKKLIHVLMLEAFVGPCPARHESLHGDGNADHNTLSNLRWGTRAENIQDQIRHGTRPCGEGHPCAKLSISDVLEIRKLIGRLTIAEVARRYPVHRSVIDQIKRGEIWRSIPQEEPA